MKHEIINLTFYKTIEMQSGQTQTGNEKRRCCVSGECSHVQEKNKKKINSRILKEVQLEEDRLQEKSRCEV